MISKACSIRFRNESDGKDPHFDNTMFSDIEWKGIWSYKYAQPFLSSQTVTVQVKVDTGVVPTMHYSDIENKSWTSMTISSASTYTSYDYYEADIDFSTFGSVTKLAFKVTVGTDVYISEPCEIVEDVYDLYQIEFFNNDSAFQVDYTTNISHLFNLYLAPMRYKPAGESEVYDNQSELTLLSGEVKRVMMLETQPIPEYLAEMLTIALRHDSFYINEIEYVAEGEPEVEAVGTFVKLRADLTQKSIIGLNTDDQGFDCDAIVTDDGVMTAEELNASGSGSFTISEGYAIAYIYLVRSSAAGTEATIDFGLSVGGSDVLNNIVLNDAMDKRLFNRPDIDTIDADYTLYYDISGAGATVNIYVSAIRLKDLT